MKVSCICPTYNRPTGFQWLVEEAIESFLRQDYLDKELIVLNDCPGQELICDAPDVLVINLPRRFSSNGEKLVLRIPSFREMWVVGLSKP